MIADLQTLFSSAFPKLDKTGQQQAKQLYALLAQGEAVSIKDFANTIDLSESQAHTLLDTWTGVSFNTNNDIEAFWGVTTNETTHSFQLDGQTLYTWCAWDLLFVPVIYKKTISAQTKCPITKKSITLTISEAGIITSDPSNPLITFIKPDLEALKKNVTGSFCQYIFFVESELTGNEWLKTNNNGFLLTLEQGFELGENIINDVFSGL